MTPSPRCRSRQENGACADVGRVRQRQEVATACASVSYSAPAHVVYVRLYTLKGGFRSNRMPTVNRVGTPAAHSRNSHRGVK
jgi:hypothetical protein